MAKHQCPCGNVLSDNSDALPYKARFIADEDVQKPLERMIEAIVGFIGAHEAGPETERIFLIQAEAAAEGLSEADAAIHWDKWHAHKDLRERLFNLLYAYWVPHQRRMFECYECGRILMQSHKGYYFVPYAPETEERGILESPTDHPANWYE